MYPQTDYPDDAARDTDRCLPDRGTRKAVRLGGLVIGQNLPLAEKAV